MASIVIGIHNVANLAYSLASGLRGLGEDASVVSYDHKFSYSVPKNIDKHVAIIRPGDDILDLILSKSPDIYINLACGSPIATPTGLQHFLSTIRRHGTKVVSIYCGSDSRPSIIGTTIYYLKTVYGTNWELYSSAMANDLALRIAFTNAADVSSDVIIDNPANWQLHRRKYFNFSNIGIPARIDLLKQIRPNEGKEELPLNILHAPSSSAYKGSSRIRKACLELARHKHINFTLVTGKPNSEVTEHLLASHLLIDELYSDASMASLGVEASSCGTPTLFAGYWKRQIDMNVRPDLIPPSIYVDPSEFESKLLELMCNPSMLVGMGLAARSFMNTKWSPNAVAKRLLSMIKEDVSHDTDIVNPTLGLYVHGCGLPADLISRLYSQGFYNKSLDLLRVNGYERFTLLFEEQFSDAK